MKDIVVGGKVIGKKYGAIKILGTVGDNVKFNIGSPCVVFDGKLYHMWCGSDVGRNKRIHYYTSIDGKVWTEFGTVLSIGDINSFDNYNICNPSVIFDGTTYHMWYNGFDGSTYKLHYATSEDGKVWNKHGVIINLGADIHRYHVTSQSIIYDGNMYKMWYNIYDGFKRKYTMCYTTSIDGMLWDKYKLVTLLENNDINDKYQQHSPSVIFNGTIFIMLYVVSDDIHSSIHYATSEDGVVWNKHGVLIPLGDDGDTDSYNIDAPFIIEDNGKYKVWYTGYDGIEERLHYAELLESSLIK